MSKLTLNKHALVAAGIVVGIIIKDILSLDTHIAKLSKNIYLKY